MYVTVETEQGKLRGQQKTSDYFSHKKYFSFQGIPFAKPPVGPLRFKDPEEPEAWSGVRDALKEGNDCIQFHLFKNGLVGSEDCLYLNVYTPQLHREAKLPVMVWIHGGGFFSGSGSTELYGPEYLIEHDVIIVTINYRLGPLGFLCLDHNEVPGNAGLKDQTMALRWVQKNVASFGGDPNRVTIFGESVGSGSVSHHIVSPLSQGLFQQAIAQSGSVLNPWACISTATSVDKAFRLGKALGCDTTDTNRLLDFLREVPVNDIITIFNTIIREDEDFTGLKLAFLPCVESRVTEHSFIPVTPRELLNQGKFAKVPTIMGANSEEGIFSAAFLDVNEDNFTKIFEKYEKFISEDLAYTTSSEKTKDISKELKQLYLGNSPITFEEKRECFFKIYGDWMFYYGIDECLRLKTENEEAGHIYAYELTHCLSNSYVKLYMQTAKPGCNYKGVNHGEDLSCFFTHTLQGVSKPSPEEQEFMTKLIKIWAAFAKTGNPNYNGMETTWEPIKKNSFCYLNIGKKLKLVHERIKQDRVAVWQQLHDKYYCKS